MMIIVCVAEQARILNFKFLEINCPGYSEASDLSLGALRSLCLCYGFNFLNEKISG